MTAALAGIDAGSDSPHERLRFLVFQRQQVMEVIKTKAMMLASLGNAEGSQKAANEYLEMAIPISGEDKDLQAFRKERLMQEVAKMAPIPLSGIKLGHAIQMQLPPVVDKKTGKEIPEQNIVMPEIPQPTKGMLPVSGAPRLPAASGARRPK